MIQSKVNLLVKGYPAIATILGFVSSNETQAGNDHTPQTEYPTHGNLQLNQHICFTRVMHVVMYNNYYGTHADTLTLKQYIILSVYM